MNILPVSDIQVSGELLIFRAVPTEGPHAFHGIKVYQSRTGTIVGCCEQCGRRVDDDLASDIVKKDVVAFEHVYNLPFSVFSATS